jgi:signal transduction histidine kinase
MPKMSRMELQRILRARGQNIPMIPMTDGRNQPRILLVRSTAHEDDSVMVSIADTGAGVAAKDCERIFNPHFTTKAEGMGMGLSICRSIIEAHDGRLWFAPNTPHGSVFRSALTAGGTAAAAA